MSPGVLKKSVTFHSNIDWQQETKKIASRREKISKKKAEKERMNQEDQQFFETLSNPSQWAAMFGLYENHAALRSSLDALFGFAYSAIGEVVPSEFARTPGAFVQRMGVLATFQTVRNNQEALSYLQIIRGLFLLEGWWQNGMLNFETPDNYS